MHAARGPAYALFLLAVIVSGCSSGPEILPSSGPHPATSPDQVKLFQKAPKQYEQLGMVSVSADEGARWDERGDATVGFDILKRKAAALGANGLLLAHDDSGTAGAGAGGTSGTGGSRGTGSTGDSADGARRLILAGYHGEYYQIPVADNPKRGFAQAIFVHKEK